MTGGVYQIRDISASYPYRRSHWGSKSLSVSALGKEAEYSYLPSRSQLLRPLIYPAHGADGWPDIRGVLLCMQTKGVWTIRRDSHTIPNALYIHWLRWDRVADREPGAGQEYFPVASPSLLTTPRSYTSRNRGQCLEKSEGYTATEAIHRKDIGAHTWISWTEKDSQLQPALAPYSVKIVLRWTKLDRWTLTVRVAEGALQLKCKFMIMDHRILWPRGTAANYYSWDWKLQRSGCSSPIPARWSRICQSERSCTM